eukprot:scaffold15223_cov100-Skeletonema_dohrnii-CCMP3373.AAC.1
MAGSDFSHGLLLLVQNDIYDLSSADDSLFLLYCFYWQECCYWWRRNMQMKRHPRLRLRLRRRAMHGITSTSSTGRSSWSIFVKSSIQIQIRAGGNTQGGVILATDSSCRSCPSIPSGFQLIIFNALRDAYVKSSLESAAQSVHLAELSVVEGWVMQQEQALLLSVSKKRSI